MEDRVIRASFDDDAIVVYQAYNTFIANHATETQSLNLPQFKKERMTWIKPSFLWMMYRSGWATKENQENILAIRISRTGFEWALQNSCLSHFDKRLYLSYESWQAKLNSTPVRIQWDPERDLFSRALPYRSIQIGLSDVAVHKYISEWTIDIKNVTNYCREIHDLIKGNKVDEAYELLPLETIYRPPQHIASIINSSLHCD
jgi:hypothetical protein